MLTSPWRIGNIVLVLDPPRQGRMMIKLRRAPHLFLYFVLVGSASAQAQTDKSGNVFDPVRFLVGARVGEVSSKAGQGQGAFSIKEYLGGVVQRLQGDQIVQGDPERVDHGPASVDYDRHPVVASTRYSHFVRFIVVCPIWHSHLLRHRNRAEFLSLTRPW